MKQKVIYYSDELNDEFSEAVIIPKVIDENYIYIHHSFIKKITHFFWYRVVATPLAYLYLQIGYRHKIIGKKKLKKAKNGYYIYGNHTHATGDAFIPSMITYPKDAYVIVHANNVSMPYLGRITPSLGAIPLPDNFKAFKNFIQAIKTRTEQGHAIVVYPEAHIWPYYTKIRPFNEASFKYPIDFKKAVYCFTNTYQKRKFSKKPKIVTYVDGPFYPKEHLTVKENMLYLRNQVYSTMEERSLNNEVTLVEYIKKETMHD